MCSRHSDFPSTLSARLPQGGNLVSPSANTLFPNCPPSVLLTTATTTAFALERGREGAATRGLYPLNSTPRRLYFERTVGSDRKTSTQTNFCTERLRVQLMRNAMSPKIDLGLDREAKSVSGVGLSVSSAAGPQLHSKSLRLASAPSSRPHVHKTFLQLFVLNYRTLF